MTHRDRVLAALSHQQPDRVPIDLGGTRDSSIVVEGYERLKERFHIEEDNTLTSRMMRVVDVSETILASLDIDVRGVFPAALSDRSSTEDRYVDEWGVERVRPPGSFYYDLTAAPLSGDISLSDIARYPWPDPTDPARRQGLADRIRSIRRQSDCAIVLNLQSAFVHTSQYLRGFEDWFVDLAGDRRIITALFDAVLELSMAINRELLDEVGGEADVVMASDDLGMQDGLIMFPELYRELLKPRHKRYFDQIHAMTPAKILFHTCGGVADILDDLVEIGVDALHPVQVSARGMDPLDLKARYAGRLAFWGAIDTQRVLPRGGTRDVEEEVERRIEELGRGGGYVLGAVHNLQPDVPANNILAMLRHAREYIPSFSG